MWNFIRSALFGDGVSSGVSDSQRRRNAASPVVAEIQVLENREVMSASTIHNWNDVLLDAIRAERPAPPAASRAAIIDHIAVTA